MLWLPFSAAAFSLLFNSFKEQQDNSEDYSGTAIMVQYNR